MATASQSPAVGIVIAARDTGAYLEETLQSLERQTFQAWTCVVVDDGSTDDTADVAQRMADRDPRIKLIRQQNMGTPAARNNGIDAIDERTPYLSFVDGDDTLEPDALHRLVEALEDAPDAVGSYGYADYMTSSGAPYAPGVHPQRQRDRRRLGRLDLTSVPASEPYTWSSWIVSGTLWPSAVALHRREVVDRVGRFDVELRQVQDWDLYLRMSRVGAFVPVDARVAWYRQHSANVTSRTDRVAFYTLLVRRRAALSADNSSAQRREVRRVHRRLAARWSLGALLSSRDAVVNRDVGGTRTALAGTSAFLRIAATGRLPAPTPRLASFLASYVMARHPRTRVLTEMPKQ